MTSASRQLRFPGSGPFGGSDLERELFRGRGDEARDLLHAILSANVTVLYAESGAGKTSLLEAAVLHDLRARGYWPVVLRMNDPAVAPIDLVRDQMTVQAEADGIDLLGIDRSEATLWEHISSLEAWRGASLLTPVLVFDQFEELFTLGWAPSQQEDFITDVGHLARGYRPATEGAPRVKIVFSIREDSLGSLEALATDIPRIMANRFRLLPLDRDAAERAMKEPAALDDARLSSRPFAFAPDATQLILRFVSTRKVGGEEVETATVGASQLQIVCSHVERKIRPDKEEPATITVDDLGGEEGLRRILADFYADQLAQLSRTEVGPARELCETALISRGRRLSLEEGVINEQHGVPTAVLDTLVEASLLRREPRVDSRYYELAHDSLVEPILEYRLEQQTDERRRKDRFWDRVRTVATAAVVVAVAGFAIGRAILESGEDFAGADLAGESFVGRDDLDDADFSGADLEDADFTDVDLLRADFTGARLIGAKLAGANLTDATLSDAILVGADLTDARLKRADFTRAQLGGARLAGANLERARLALVRAERADFSDADLGGSDLTGADLDRANLAGANLRGAMLDGTSLGTDLTRTDLDRVSFRGAILAEADLSGADLRGQSFSGANLLASVLAGADLRGVVLVNATLRFADLSGATLQGADLRGANLSGADLAATVLEEADLANANFSGTNLGDADLTGANLGEPDLVIEIVAASQTRGGLEVDWRITNRHAADAEFTTVAIEVEFLESLVPGSETSRVVGTDRVSTFGPIRGGASFVERVTFPNAPTSTGVVASIDVCSTEEERRAGCSVAESQESNNTSDPFFLARS